ncbi:hypothetical protein KR074_008208 [Drosophila pseudoananassae]|nr:hypothetical protein KR074_008208 [Drosophila pseudoananassae]
MNTSLANLLVGEGSAKEDEHPGDLANDLIDDLLKKHPKEGHYDSDSRDESCPARSRSKCSVDRRLEYWKDMLLQRRTLQEKLRAQTGRGPAQMLHNRPQRPEDLLEIVGIAQETNSDMTEQDVVHFSRPGKYLLPHFPDKIFRGFSNLALDLDSSSSTVSSEPRLTRKRSGSKAAMPDSIQPYSMTNKCGDNCIVQCVRINGIHYRPGTPEFSPIVERTFTCHPFQRHVRTVVRIENSGRVMLRCCWRRVNFFSNNGTLLKDDSENFLFDTQCFQLHIGETRDVTILYQPRKVSIVKMRWLLCTQPGIFYRRPYGLTLNIHGRCTPSMQYLEMLAVEKTRARLLSVEQRVSQSQEEKEPEKPVLCPYVREIEEREVFNILNRRYFCQTYEDLERLHAFFEKITKSSSLWNLSVECLFHHVFAVRDIEARIQLSEELNTLLDGLRNPLELPLADSDSPSLLQKRGNSGFLYVRGLLASRLDEWEQLAMELEKKSVDYMYFINSIYTLLYGMIGNTVEDIVSIIESLLESSEM